jgi:CRP/FNR family cyclic AMP-dependent transcriptional regulator
MNSANTEPDVQDLTPAGLAETYYGGDAFARRLIETAAERVHLCQGEVLFAQGNPGDSMYLVLEGRLGVRLRHADGSETDLHELGPDAIVGEMALLTA